MSHLHLYVRKTARQLSLFLLVSRFTASVWAQLLSGHFELKEERRKKKMYVVRKSPAVRQTPRPQIKSLQQSVTWALMAHPEHKIALFDDNYKRLRDYFNSTLLISIYTLFWISLFESRGTLHGGNVQPVQIDCSLHITKLLSAQGCCFSLLLFSSSAAIDYGSIIMCIVVLLNAFKWVYVTTLLCFFVFITSFCGCLLSLRSCIYGIHVSATMVHAKMVI